MVMMMLMMMMMMMMIETDPLPLMGACSWGLLLTRWP